VIVSRKICTCVLTAGNKRNRIRAAASGAERALM
jgi:hypothetical protein